jgi:hypothetical protein
MRKRITSVLVADTRHAPRKREAQYTCKARLRADGSNDAQTSSDEESEAEVEDGGGGRR